MKNEQSAQEEFLLELYRKENAEKIKEGWQQPLILDELCLENDTSRKYSASIDAFYVDQSNMKVGVELYARIGINSFPNAENLKPTHEKKLTDDAWKLITLKRAGKIDKGVLLVHPRIKEILENETSRFLYFSLQTNGICLEAYPLQNELDQRQHFINILVGQITQSLNRGSKFLKNLEFPDRGKPIDVIEYMEELRKEKNETQTIEELEELNEYILTEMER